MTPEELAKIKVGDEVFVRAKVLGVDGCAIKVLPENFIGEDAAQWTEAEDCRDHTPRALSVGDRVRNRKCAKFPDGYEGGEILAIHGSHAWVLFPGMASPGSPLLSDLERIDP